LTAPWTEGGVVEAECSAEVGVQESTCLVVSGEVETVGAAPFGWEEDVLRV